MIHFSGPFLAASVAALTVSLVAFTGCERTSNSSTSAPVGATDSILTEPAEGQAAWEGQKGENATTVISGNLDNVDWGSLVGQQVRIDGDLVVVDTFNLMHRGQVVVARERIFIPTEHVDPNDTDPNGTAHEGGRNVAAVTAAQTHNDNSTITIDDGSTAENVFPPALFPTLGTSEATVRLGSVVEGVSGRLIESGNQLTLVPDQPLRWIPSPRPQRPSLGEADVTVAGFNLLNYFSTIDDGRNNARGADSAAELQRQEAKLASAIVALQADVIGLMELENGVEAEQKLVSAVNKVIGKDVFKSSGLPEGFRRLPGAGDAIRVGIIYRKDRVVPTDKLSSIDDRVFATARTPLLQSFRSVEGGSPFTVIVNHFKSKGGASDADTANRNKGDGQGAFNAARRNQTLAIVDYIDHQTTTGGPSRILVLGDFNAYRQEDPIDALRAHGLVDLHDRFARNRSQGNPDTYSYVYFGQSGSLDHAFATKTLAADVTGIATWHINADEPRFLDYNQEFNPKALFNADPYRSSDHDPILIGLNNTVD
ncbi:Endonuclease/Exonuclease/phosphatase family protein [Stieleria maiorica]|uniref:Endonuclease/Exonuclease/phosphatase family protein n=1 Tax=Stieleria maiorica TaxID=2795974 RepID=A0A5B9MGN3_9BACT|nr:ExeM/NucH family extracellular endonuclease [Stieleria maiorica]QEF99276.1 Endonuclease/Exonuclease/phosphatase family protein [Stieleria maiorica]